MRRATVFWSFFVVCCLGVVPCRAQEVLWRVTAPAGETYARSAVFLSDLDGDGYEDIAAVVLQGLSISGPNATRILSGRDGSVMRTDPIGSELYQVLVRAGDMDGDGVVDYAMFRDPLSRQTPTVEVRSGADGSPLWSVVGPPNVSYGMGLLGDLDVNGDGRPDLLITANSIPPRVFAHDHGGLPLYRTPLDIGIWRIGGTTDIDGDGCDDWIVGGEAGSQRFGVIQLRSGKTGGFLRQVVGQSPFDVIGKDGVGGVGDLDGDGLADFVGTSGGVPPGLGPTAEVFSSASGQRLRTWRRAPRTFGGLGVVADLDRDGVADLLVSSTTCAAGTAWKWEWLSLRDGSTVACFEEPLSSVEVGAPHPGDVFPVIAFLDLNGSGQVTLRRAAPPRVRTLGPSCAGTLAAAPRIGWRVHGTAGARVHLSNAPAGAPAILLLGISSQTWMGAPLPLGLEPFGLAGCTLQTSVELAIPVVAGTSGIDRGYAAVDVPWLRGRINAQWLVLDAAAPPGAAVSEGLSW